MANKARSRSWEGGATNIIYGFKSELRSVFRDCKNRSEYLTVPPRKRAFIDALFTCYDIHMMIYTLQTQLHNIITEIELTVTVFRVQAPFSTKFIFNIFQLHETIFSWFFFLIFKYLLLFLYN